MRVNVRKTIFPAILAIVMLFGLYVQQPANVTANSNAGSTPVETYSVCGKWETYKTTHRCDGNVTIVTYYQKRYCQGKGWEEQVVYDSFPGCIAM